MFRRDNGTVSVTDEHHPIISEPFIRERRVADLGNVQRHLPNGIELIHGSREDGVKHQGVGGLPDDRVRTSFQGPT